MTDVLEMLDTPGALLDERAFEEWWMHNAPNDDEPWPEIEEPWPEIEEMGAEEALDIVAAERRRIAWSSARMSRAMARFARLREQQDNDYAAEELALVTVASPASASARLSEAQHLAQHLPGTLALLDIGELDSQQAHAIADATRELPRELLSALEGRILHKAPGWTPSQLRERIRYHIARLDPAGTRERQQERRRRRGVFFQDLGDGMAGLTAELPIQDAYRIYRHLCEHAARARSSGDERGSDQLRADVLTDLLLGNDREHVHTEVQIMVPAGTLAGTTDEAGELVGAGPLDADTVRELAQDATWRRILTDPADDTVLNVGRRRFPSPALARHVRARDRRCRFPGCARSAYACHIDHTTPYADGGETSHDNLAALCPRHNQMKEDTPWAATQPQPGVVEWTSPTGATRTVTPNDEPPPF